MYIPQGWLPERSPLLALPSLDARGAAPLPAARARPRRHRRARGGGARVRHHRQGAGDQGQQPRLQHPHRRLRALDTQVSVFIRCSVSLFI